jgi:hypothetical protein
MATNFNGSAITPNPTVPPGTVPVGGATGNVLAKLDGADPIDSYEWADPATVPAIAALEARVAALEAAVAGLAGAQQPAFNRPAPGGSGGPRYA